MIRCLLGFFIGSVCFDLYPLVKRKEKEYVGSNIAATISLVEICSVGLVILFVFFCGNGPISLAAPLIFGITVIIFSLESGVVSKVLKTRPFLFLGTLSYSIYMVHALVLVAMGYAIQLAEREFGIVLRKDGYFGAQMWQGAIFYVVYIWLVVGTAYLTYTFIEQPGTIAGNSVYGEHSRRAENDEQRTQTAQETPAGDGLMIRPARLLGTNSIRLRAFELYLARHFG